MPNVSDIKPWFREDLARTLMSIYFASKCGTPPRPSPNDKEQERNLEREQAYETGFAAALSSVALAVGVNPESFLAPEDVQRLRKVGG